MEPKIQHLRLINGDEIIGVVLNESKTSILVDQPLVVFQQESENGSFLALRKYIPYSSENIINLQRGHVIATTDLHKDIIKYYFLSLKVSKYQDDIVLKSIQNTNYMLEQLLASKNIDISDKMIHVTPGTSTIQ
jgi:hypothetical protein